MAGFNSQLSSIRAAGSGPAVSASGYSQLNNAPVFKHIDGIYTDRLKQFLDGGRYRDFNLPKVYDKARIDNHKDTNDTAKGYIDLKVHSVPDLQKPLFRDIIPKLADDDWKDTTKGASFGPSWSTHWFKVTAKVPDDWLKEEQVIFDWDCDNEGLVYTTDGEPLQAFTGGGERTEFILPKKWYADGNSFMFYVEAACNGMFGVGNGTTDPPNPDRYFTLKTADLVVPNLAARGLHIDFWEIGDSAREMPGDSWQKHKARTLGNEIMNVFDAENPDATIKEAQKLAATYVGDKVYSEKVYADTDYNKVDVFAVAMTHIDSAWLWPLSETRRKVIRSWNTQVDLLNRYPEHVFAASQIQQFVWLKEDSPISFKKIKEKVEEGRFIPIGGSWVEHDTNVPGGESLGRQFLKGQLYFQQNFNVQSDTFWLPDTFGYSSQIPQLCRLSNMDRFLTQKLSWNNINSFPLSTFNWVSLDGSQVLAHMPPNNTYTSEANFGDVRRSLTQHKNLAYDNKGLLLYGKGDGGGGPTPEYFEKLRRTRGIADTVGELPRVHVGCTVKDFYDQVLKDTDNGAKLPSWNGELYFEFHRGTYTTQAKMKKFVRWSEFNLHDLEYFSTLASLFKKSYCFPKNELSSFWEDLLLCHFHDILPGTCIEMVYQDTRPMLSKVIHKSHELILKTLKALGIHDLVHDSHHKKFSSQSIINASELLEGEFNLLSTYNWTRSEVVKIPRVSSLIDNGDKSNIYQKVEKFVQKGAENDYIYVSNKKSNNNHILAPVTTKIKYPSTLDETSDFFVLENNKLKVFIDKKTGVIASLIDLELNKEVLDTKTGQNKTGANQFVLLKDTPLDWPAWDTELFSLEKIILLKATSVTQYEKGPLRSAVKIVIDIPATSNTLEASQIVSIISLAGLNSPSDYSYVEVENKVVWRENSKFLKVEFPVDIRNDTANYETQFGITKRPTHYNTTWDVAKFEVCHHKFADYSEHNYGVSILNDSKYGFSTHGNLMRLSLLRASKGPDEHADMDTHFFRYAIYPHKGPLNDDVVKLGYNFNNKLLHNSLDDPGDAAEGNQYYKLKKVRNSLGHPDVTIEETNFGTNLVVSKVNEFTEDFFDFVSVKGDSSIILSNVKRYENDEDVFINYAKEVLDDKEQLIEQLIASQKKTLSIDTSNPREVSKWKGKLRESVGSTKSVILRVYESLGGKGTTTIHVKKLLKLTKVVKVNNLEEDLEELEFASTNDGLYYTVNVGLRAFEIAGFRLEFQI